MNKMFHETIGESLLIARRLIDLADKTVAECKDDSCLLLCAMIRDSGYAVERAVMLYLDTFHETD